MSGSATFRVRGAMAGDVPMLAKHRVEMFRDMGRLSSEGAAAELRNAAEPLLGEWIAAGTYVGWLAEPLSRPGLVVGGAGIQLRAMLPRPSRDGSGLVTGPEAYVLNVFVERAWRRRGVATAAPRHAPCHPGGTPALRAPRLRCHQRNATGMTRDVDAAGGVQRRGEVVRAIT
jgi:GNAT superfamily N-acetyltransferase